MNLVPAVAPMSFLQAESLSTDRLRLHFPGLLTIPGRVDVVEVFELLQDYYGLDTAVAELPDGIEGRTWPNGKVELSEKTYIGACNDDERARFTVVHECKHAWHHARQIRSVLESGVGLRLNRRHQIPAYMDPEWQANTLTAAFLMPLPAMRILNDRGHLTVAAVQETFGVSFTAASLRIKLLKEKNLF